MRDTGVVLASRLVEYALALSGILLVLAMAWRTGP